MMKAKHLFLFLTCYTFLFLILFPGYRYIIDPDATGYLSVAEQYAKGNYHNAINGIWSPLGSWMIVPSLRLNFDGILTAKYLNGLYGFLSLAAFFYFIKKLKVIFFIEILIMSCGVLLILHFTVFRLFGDLLQVLLLLLYLNVICSKKFGTGYKEIILAAFIGGVAFYAKAYVFYFILIHLPIAVYLSGEKDFRKRLNFQFIKKLLAGVIILIATISPWIIALNHKYGHFILGQQNISGTLSPAYGQPRVSFYAPPFNGAYSIFDDISYRQFTNITPFTNSKLFLAELKLIAFNIIKTIEHFNDFSFTFLFIILIALFLCLLKFKDFINSKKNIILLSFIIMWPSGFLLFHVEPRYLWIIILAVLALTGVLLSFLFYSISINKKYASLFSWLIIGNFFLYPLLILKEQYGKEKNYFEIARALKQNNIKGNVLYSNEVSDDFSKSIIINYLSDNRHYGLFTTDYTIEELKNATKKYDINYMIFYYNGPMQKEMTLRNSISLKPSVILSDIYLGIIVLKFN